jgi:hypothetical protein
MAEVLVFAVPSQRLRANLKHNIRKRETIAHPFSFARLANAQCNHGRRWLPGAPARKFRDPPNMISTWLRLFFQSNP